MHEVGIMQSALEVAFEQATLESATRIHRIGMRIGVFSGVVEDALRFAFEAFTPGTMAEGADFKVELVPAKSTCQLCNLEYAVGDLASLKCPECGGDPAGFEGGREIEVSEIEVS